MKNPTEGTRWVVTILLAVAAIIACTLMPRLIDVPIDRWFVVILFMTLLAICAVLSLRYQGKG